MIVDDDDRVLHLSVTRHRSRRATITLRQIYSATAFDHIHDNKVNERGDILR